MAESKSGKCISTKYKNANSLLIWKCKKGHTWKATYGNVYAGKWCFQCSDTTLSINDAKKIALSKKGRCISTLYINCYTNLKWECLKGHIWEANLSNIRRTWCPKCRASKSQNKIAKIIKKIFECEIKENFKGFYWLKSKNGAKMEIDIWAPKLKLAIEYDGEHHFMPINYGGMSNKKAKELHKKTKKLDKIIQKEARIIIKSKSNKIINAGETFK